MSKKKVEIPTMDQIENARERLKYKSRFRTTVRSTLSVLLVAAAVSVLVATLWMPVFQIFGSSMSPTLKDGEIVVSLKSKSFKTGDLVAFYYGNKVLVKRVICGPGDWVSIDEAGNVFVNGEQIDEPYLREKAYGECTIEFPYQVPEKRWFVLGDNRAVSVDSRSSQLGCVSEEQLIGKIVFRVWPLGKFSKIQ